jgi:hypothetical protein
VAVARALGDYTTKRAGLQLDTMSCVLPSGRAVSQSVTGWVAGPDGVFGMPGELVEREGPYLARVSLAGFLHGASAAFAAAQTTTSIGALGNTTTTITGNEALYGALSGLANSANRMAAFYERQLESLVPAIYVPSGLAGSAVIQGGVTLIVTEQAQADKAHGQLGQQFGEVTAYPFPVGAVMELLGFDFLCTPDDLRSQTTLSAAASYSSRLDEVPWRTGGLETVLAEATVPGATALSVGCALDSLVSVPYLGGLCMGVWGPLFARAGWLIHGSQPVGSGAVAYRAAHIISWPELLWGRVAVPAFDFRATTSDKMNIVAPTLMGCIRPGTYGSVSV